MTLHPFESAGLGKAPFHCTHVHDSWSACQFCGTPIRYQFWIEGSDGSHFYVGSDCVAKTGGAEHIDNFRAVRLEHVRKLREMKAAERRKAREAQWAAEAAAKRVAFDAEHPGLYATLTELAKGSNFCADMVRSIDRFGGLTPRQLEVVNRIVLETLDKERQKAAGIPKVVGDLKPLAEMFRHAREHLKYPKLTVHIGDADYCFSLAGDASRNPGHLYVKRNGTYIGKVSPAGEFYTVREAVEADRAAVNEFSKNPVAVAGLHGRTTGCCAFCSKPLSDERSVEVGYGPVCAQHFNLPWG